MRIELSCESCHQNNFSFPEDSDDDATVVCVDCGHVVGSMGALKQAVAEAVIAKSPEPNIRKKLRK